MAIEVSRPIRSLRGYRAALGEADALGEAPVHDENRLKALTALIRDYERTQLLFDDPDPVDFLRRIMKARALRQKDLEPCIGSRAKLAEVLNRSRPLTLGMISRLSTELKLPAEVLLRKHRRSA